MIIKGTAASTITPTIREPLNRKKQKIKVLLHLPQPRGSADVSFGAREELLWRHRRLSTAYAKTFNDRDDPKLQTQTHVTSYMSLFVSIYHHTTMYIMYLCIMKIICSGVSDFILAYFVF
jgi:hypothetical protein